MKKLFILFLSLSIVGCGNDEMSSENDATKVASTPQKGNGVESEIKCGDSTLVSLSVCTKEDKHWTTCTSQKIKIKNKEKPERELFSVKTFKVEGAKEEQLDHKVNRWACLGDEYFLLEYTNGGNCEECEWHEMLNGEGERLTYDEKILISKSKFDEFYKSLKLKQWPRDKFLKVELAQ